MPLFADRVAAGKELAAALAAWRGVDGVVFGIPRGGVVVAAEVSRALGLPLRAAVVRKLGAPAREELAVGAIADGVRVVDDGFLRRAGVTSAQLELIEKRERRELARRAELFAPRPADLSGRTAVVVDDGIATGSTAVAACRALRAAGAHRILLAAPVAPARWTPDSDVADEYVCPHRERDFWAMGQYYGDFRQTTDAEVLTLLARNGDGAD